MKTSLFEQYPKSTLLGIIVVLSFISLVFIEISAKKIFGLGKTVIYHSHPIYGYRPKENQTVARQSHHIVKINNLGFRADQDWDPADFSNKILFLGDSVTYGGSYISNHELFSSLAVKNLSPYLVGNAGVNGWGVNNVHAFIKEMEFLPAQIYISVFPEGDFYRGLMRIGGQPFWTKPPQFALEELLQYFIYQVHAKKTPPLNLFQLGEQDKTRIAEIAVRNLKDLDDYLKANHRLHLIYITPSLRQVQHLETEDKIIKKLFEKYDVKVIYLKDRLALSFAEAPALYHDNIHLSTQGHLVWANLISSDLQNIIDTN